MSRAESQARTEEARQKLPMKRLLEQNGHGPSGVGEKWSNFKCPFCGKKSASVFVKGGSPELFKCFNTGSSQKRSGPGGPACPSLGMGKALDEGKVMGLLRGVNGVEGWKIWLKEAGVWVEERLGPSVLPGTRARKSAKERELRPPTDGEVEAGEEGEVGVRGEGASDSARGRARSPSDSARGRARSPSDSARGGRAPHGDGGGRGPDEVVAGGEGRKAENDLAGGLSPNTNPLESPGAEPSAHNDGEDASETSNPQGGSGRGESEAGASPAGPEGGRAPDALTAEGDGEAVSAAEPEPRQESSTAGAPGSLGEGAPARPDAGSPEGVAAAAAAEFEELLERACETVLGDLHASVALLQRKLNLGYARAKGLMDELEKRGVVGPSAGTGSPRVILVGEMGKAKLMLSMGRPGPAAVSVSSGAVGASGDGNGGSEAGAPRIAPEGGHAPHRMAPEGGHAPHGAQGVEVDGAAMRRLAAGWRAQGLTIGSEYHGVLGDMVRETFLKCASELELWVERGAEVGAGEVVGSEAGAGGNGGSEAGAPRIAPGAGTLPIG